MKYQSTKTFGHELGLTSCYRQHKADSHCKFLHGYALSFKFVFEADKLDKNNWVVDFGGPAMKALKNNLVFLFDHKMIVAVDDPHLDDLFILQRLKVARIITVNKVGCEAFAEMAFCLARDALAEFRLDHARVVSCEVSEHGANSAIYYGNPTYMENPK